MTAVLMTKAQYAEKRGVTKAYLSKPQIVELLAPAMVKDPENPAKMKIDPAIADELFNSHSDPARASKRKKAKANDDDKSSSDTRSFASTKNDRELIKLAQDRLALAEKLGQTLSRHEVESAFAGAGQFIREQLKARNHQIADKAATMTDARAIKAMLDESDRLILQTISDELIRKHIISGQGQSVSVD